MKKLLFAALICASCQSESFRNTKSTLNDLKGEWQLSSIADKEVGTQKSIPYPSVLNVTFDACNAKDPTCMAHFSTKTGQNIDVAYEFVYGPDLTMINFTKNADLEADPVLSQIVTSWQIGTVEKSRVQIFSPIFPIYELVLTR